jgi:hypothetical protein
METDKDKMMKGVNFLAMAFPFIFFGPALFFWKGAEGMRSGEWWWPLLSLLIMGFAVFMAVKGLRMVISALFDRN